MDIAQKVTDPFDRDCDFQIIRHTSNPVTLLGTEFNNTNLVPFLLASVDFSTNETASHSPGFKIRRL